MLYTLLVPPVPWRRSVLSRVLRRARGSRRPGRRGAVRAKELDSAFEAAPVAMAVLRPGGMLLRANGALCDLLDRPTEDLVGGTLFEHTHPDDLSRAVEACEQMSNGRVDLTELECRLLRPDGVPRRTVVTTSLVRHRHGAPAYLVLHVQDVTERHAAEGELRHQSLHDALTGLPNRTLLADRLEQTVATCGRDGSSFVLMFLDLDRFKGINDRFGHDVGDAVLIEVAKRVRDAVRPGDTVARLAGDEFVVLCPAVGARQAGELRRRVLSSVCGPFLSGQGEVILSASVGLAMGAAGSLPAAILREADQRMYRDKAARRPSADRSP